MTVAGGSEGSLDPTVGDPILESKEQDVHPDSGGAPATEFRRSERKKGLRNILTRGRLAKARPKSPLMRMAEMRKEGLRGKALRHSGRKGFESSDSILGSGNKKSGGKKMQVMDSIAEGVEVKGGSLVGSEGGEVLVGGGVLVELEGDMVVDADAGPRDDLLVLSSHSDKPEVGLEAQSELIPEGVSADLALDLIASQPLQDMTFVGEQLKSVSPEMDNLMLESQHGENLENEMGVNLDQRRESQHEEDFPSLSLDNLRLAKEREKIRGGGERKLRRGRDLWERGRVRRG